MMICGWHSIVNKPYFAIIVSDQHEVAKVPTCDGLCIASIRHQDLSLAQIVDHTLWMIADCANLRRRSLTVLMSLVPALLSRRP